MANFRRFVAVLSVVVVLVPLLAHMPGAAAEGPTLERVAGTIGEGTATNVGQRPQGIAVHGTTLYISDGNGTNVVRALDLTTRNGPPVAAGRPIAPTVTGVGGVPASGVSAVVLNVTVTGPTSPSFLTVYPNGSPRPKASNLNFVPGQTVPNLVIAKVGADGKVAVSNDAGSTHVVIDVVGWYSP